MCIQIIGYDNAVAFAGSQGNFELNAMRPMIINNVLHWARILGDASIQLCEYGIKGIKLDQGRIERYVGDSLMLVIVLSPVIGYDKASEIAHPALDENITLRDATVKGGFVRPEEFDRIVDPRKMVGDPHRDLMME